jgi:hypothetical protein
MCDWRISPGTQRPSSSFHREHQITLQAATESCWCRQLMQFPKIVHCLICDAVRFEVQGKLPLLGFLGFSPDVRITLGKFGTMLPLAFVLYGGSVQGNYQIAWTVVDSEGKHLFPPQSSPLNMPQAEKLAMVLQVHASYPGPGEYRLQVSVNGRPHYEAAFTLLAAGQVSEKVSP